MTHAYLSVYVKKFGKGDFLILLLHNDDMLISYKKYIKKV